MMNSPRYLSYGEHQTQWKWSEDPAAPTTASFFGPTKGDPSPTVAAVLPPAVSPLNQNNDLRHEHYRALLHRTLGTDSRAMAAASQFCTPQRLLPASYKNRMFVQHEYQDHAALQPQNPQNNPVGPERSDSLLYPSGDTPKSIYFLNKQSCFDEGQFNSEMTKTAPDQVIMSNLNPSEAVQHNALPSPSYENQPPMIILDPPTRVLFPERVYNMLNDSSKDEKLKAILSWQPHGRCFVVRKPKEFVSIVLPRYFRGQHKMTSFQRQLNIYGFKRISQGRDYGAYYHELFLRGRPYLCRFITRKQVKGNRVKPIPNPGMEPDFYKMKPCLETDQESEPTGAISRAVSSVAGSISTGGFASHSLNVTPNYREHQTPLVRSFQHEELSSLHSTKEWMIPNSFSMQPEFSRKSSPSLPGQPCTEPMALKSMLRDFQHMSNVVDPRHFPLVSQERRCRDFDSMRRPLHLFNASGMSTGTCVDDKFSFQCNPGATQVSLSDVSGLGQYAPPSMRVLNEQLSPMGYQMHEYNDMEQNMGDLEEVDKDPLLDEDIASVDSKSLEVDDELDQY